MAIAFDASSNATAGTGNLSWTHTPVGTPKGVMVFVVANATLLDHVSGVTYGGTAMTEVALSPASFDTSVDSTVHGFFLGSSVPTGAQTVAVTVSGSSAKQAVAFTVTADADTEVVDTTQATGSSAPSGTLSLGGASCWCALGGQTNASAVANVSPLTDWTSTHEHDFGAEVGVFYRYNTIGTADVTFGWSDGSGPEPGNALGVAIKESAAASGVLGAGVLESKALTRVRLVT
jgi:hypothetical protein